MNKEKQIVPELRFPDFEDNWNIIKGENITNKISKGSSPKWQGFDYVDEGILFVTSENVRDGFLDISKPKYLEYGFHEKQKNSQLKKGDILINIVGASIGRSTIFNLDIEANINQAVAIFRVKKDVSKDFVSYFLQLDETQKRMFGVQSESARPNLSLTNLKELLFSIPTYLEQQKIANCLSSLDEVIYSATAKLNLLKDHKNGLLEQLFPQEGETKPQYRFPEFENDGDWEQKCVDDFFDVGSSKRVLQKDWVKEGIPFYRTRELVSLSKNEPFGSEIYITEKLFLKLSEKYGVPKAGDFLVSGVGTLGILYQVKENDKFYFKDGNVIWFKHNSGIISEFFKHCFYTKFFQKQIFGQSSASTVGTYTISNARKTKFWKPIRKEEQQKIANCLSSADDLIQEQILKIETLKEHKKGLMQQIFPNINDN